MKWFNSLLYDDWKTILRKATNWYNKAMFYQNFAKGQIFQPLGLVNETLWILTYLAVLGIKPTPKWIVITYLSVLGFLILLGKFLVWLGWMRYIQKLGNAENPEIREIVEWVREQKKK